MKVKVNGMRNNQTGTILVLSLIILTVLTLVAVTGMRSSVTEEKMSGNLRNHELAFQAADGALRIAFNTINGWTAPSDITGTDGLLKEENDDPDYYQDSTWSTIGLYSSAPHIGDGKLADVPKFVIKFVDTRDPCDPDGLEKGGGPIIPPCPTDIYRVTGQGTGLTADTVVTLQAYFGRLIF